MEIEAKFAVPDEATWWQLQAIEQLAGYTLSPGVTKQVHDTFVDTPDRSILSSRHVCRQREVDGQIVMTLKGSQTVEGAVHRREELEVTLPRVLPIDQWPESEIRNRLLAIVGGAPLAPLFDQHQTRVVRWVTQNDRVVAEMSVDKVELSINAKEQRYFEVEVELKGEGTEADLETIAAGLSTKWSLQPEPRSKFARALAMAQGETA